MRTGRNEGRWHTLPGPGVRSVRRFGVRGLPPLSPGASGQANEGSAKNPPKGEFVEGVFYVAATLRGFRARSRDPQGCFGPGDTLREKTLGEFFRNSRKPTVAAEEWVGRMRWSGRSPAMRRGTQKTRMLPRRCGVLLRRRGWVKKAGASSRTPYGVKRAGVSARLRRGCRVRRSGGGGGCLV